MKNLCIIPARGGSKRIPRKNIREFLGKPIISYSIEAALNSKLFDEVMVSTDDKEIAEVSVESGANVPFLRSILNSDDNATTADVLVEVLNKYKALVKEFEYICCLYPTAPLIKPNILQEGRQLLIENDFDTVFAVLRYSYPIWRSFQIANQKVKLNWPEHLNSRSQDLTPAYHDSGQFYWLKVDEFLKSEKIFTENSGAVELSDLEAQDIDNESDWKLAELKYSLLHKID